MSRRLSVGCAVAAQSASAIRLAPGVLDALKPHRARKPPTVSPASCRPPTAGEMPRQNRDAGEDSAIAQQFGAVDARDLVRILPRDRLAGLFVRRAGKHGLRAFAAAADAAFEKHLVGCFPVVFDDPLLERQRGLGFASP